ncbi:MAG: ABC transporter permease [Promethearchaeota archaeon]|jgi:peptide/nickel transport system permease protein
MIDKKNQFWKRQFENRIRLEGDTRKKRIIRYLKFFLLPFYRAQEINEAEYEIGKTKSKRTFFRRFITPLTILGMVCFLFILWCAVFPNWASKYAFDDIAVWVNIYEDAYEAPSARHPLGTGESAWDILARNIWSSRFSLQVAFLSVVIAFVLGILLGIISAYAGGWVDNVLMRIVDAFVVFPGLILAFLFIAIWGNQLLYIMIALGLAGIPAYARIARASALQEKRKLYVDAGKTAGASRFKLMFKHILPNAWSPLIVRVTFNLAVATLGIAGLSFLGFAVSDVPTWGWDINAARDQMYRAPWAMVWPGVWITIAALGFQLIGDGLRDALDPKLKVL